MYYNVIIRLNGGKNRYLILIDNQDVQDLVRAFYEGEGEVLISGRKIKLNNPELFVIFKIKQAYEHLSKYDLRNLLKKVLVKEI